MDDAFSSASPGRPKTCRYGCGELHLEDGVWQLPAFRLDPGLTDMGLKPSDMVFTVKILLCKTCGYVELTDYHATKDDERNHS